VNASQQRVASGKQQAGRRGADSRRGRCDGVVEHFQGGLLLGPGDPGLSQKAFWAIWKLRRRRPNHAGRCARPWCGLRRRRPTDWRPAKMVRRQTGGGSVPRRGRGAESVALSSPPGTACARGRATTLPCTWYYGIHSSPRSVPPPGCVAVHETRRCARTQMHPLIHGPPPASRLVDATRGLLRCAAAMATCHSK
jgi:hypothetical protein